MDVSGMSADLLSGPLGVLKQCQPHSQPSSPGACHMRATNFTPGLSNPNDQRQQDRSPFLPPNSAGGLGAMVSAPSYTLPGAQQPNIYVTGTSADQQHAVAGSNGGETSDGNASLPKDSGRVETGVPADDSKVLANPKGIIKSYLPQAAAMDATKFAAYRDLCFAHVDEYHKHQKGATWAQCRLCRGTFRHWNTLQRHLQSHIDFRPFACTNCGRAFYSQSKLKRHAVVHSDIKPYPCPVCDRRLGRTEHLKRHLLVHTDAKPYGCSACAHTTKRLDGIRRHIKRKHGTTGGAEIVGLETPPSVLSLGAVPQNLAQGEGGEPPKPKPKKKKKKKAATPNPEVQMNGGEAQGLKDCASSLMDVAMRFGIDDLRMPSTSATDAARYFAESPAPPPKDMSRYGVGQVQSAEDMKQMQLIYQSLARSHASSTGVAAHTGISPNAGPGRPVNLLAAPAHLPQPHPFSPSHQQARHAALQLPHPDHGFLVNSGVGASGMPAAAMRYVQTSDGTGRAMNPVIFAPTATGHFASSDADMISQYIQSQQRFVPPVWGIANHPNFPNY